MTVLLLPVLYSTHRNNFYVACTGLDHAIQIQMDTEFHCFDAEHTVVIYGSLCVCVWGGTSTCHSLHVVIRGQFSHSTMPVPGIELWLLGGTSRLSNLGLQLEICYGECGAVGTLF